MKLSGAEILLNCLCEQGINTIFGYPGSFVLSVYDKLLDFPIRHILTAHEQGACFAAEGYSRASGKTGVVLTTSGPGATNLVTGIADAYMDSIPLVAITGNVPLSMLGHDCFQEVDIFGMTMPVVKYSYIVKSAAELAATVREAFVLAASGRKGPVLIDVPSNVFEETAEYEKAQPLETERKPINLQELNRVAGYINSAERPLIYAGGGVIASGATKQLQALAKKLSAPVAVSFMGIGAVPCDFENYIGVASDRNPAPISAFKQCDLLICVGARFNNRVNANGTLIKKRKLPVVQIDIDLAEIDKNVATAHAVVGDVGEVIAKLIPLLVGNNNEEWVHNDFGKCTIQNRGTEILRALSSLISPRTPIVTDVGLHQVWTALSYPFKYPRTLITSGGLGVMGFGMGAAIGACFATNERIVLITGDGSFNMNLTELATAVKHKLGIVVIVMNNSALGMVRQKQREKYNRRYSQSTLYLKTDYVALAKAFGAAGFTLDAEDDIETVLTAALKIKTPVVIDCKIPINDE